MSARGPEQQQVAFDCLALTLKHSPGHTNASDVLTVADQFYAFVTGLPSKTPREQIDAALDAADVR